MRKSLLFGALCAFAMSSAATADTQLDGYSGDTNNSPPSDRVECLFFGDLIPELGIGCSNPSGTSGGPNDIAVYIESPETIPPIWITSIFYNVFTMNSPNITQLSCVVWDGGLSEIARQSVAPNWFDGNNTVQVNLGPICPPFYFGLNQNQTDVGLRWGVDSSSGSWGTSYIRAPVCGATDFMLLDSLGFPGNWVMMACASPGHGDCGSTPVELRSWGGLKARYQ